MRLAAALLLLAAAGGVGVLAFGGHGGGDAVPPAARKLAEVTVPMPPPLAPPKPVTAAMPPAATAPAAAPAPQTAALPPLPSPPPREQSSAQPLLPAPDPALVETGPTGPLPIIGRDGRQPWLAYGRPFDRADKRPRIAIVITGLGLAGEATKTAIDALPPAVTLAFDPYTKRLGEWVARARGAGHEVLLSLPMEPVDYPRQDPGPATLLTSLSPRENLERLDWVLSRVSGYVGLTPMMGSRFTTSQTSLVPVMDELKKRGLMFVDGRASPQSVAGALAESLALPHVVADDTIDADATREAIDRHLAALETAAQRDGAALGIGFDYPSTLERVALWAKTLDAKNIALAPASALPALPGEQKRVGQ
jgi:polysaccharide deacetylase 2 family uncharacterized protein YibQ